MKNRLWTAALMAANAAAFAADTPVDAAKSSIVARFEQMNVPVEAPFKKFSGTVSYDANAPAGAKAHLEVDTASLDIGDDYNAEVRKPEWFDSAKYPKATFDADGLKPLGGGKFEAAGKLALKGRVQALKVPVTIGSQGPSTVFDGSVPISRAYFAIGDASWKDTVADTVTVRFHIVVPAAH